MTTPGDPGWRSDPEGGAATWQRQHWQPPEAGPLPYEEPHHGEPQQYGEPPQYGEQPQYGVPGYGQQADEQASPFGQYQYHYAPPEIGQQQQSEYGLPLYGGAQLYGQSAPETFGGQAHPAPGMPLARPPRRRRRVLIAGSLLALVLVAVAGFVVWKVVDKHDSSTPAASTTFPPPAPATSGSAAPVAGGGAAAAIPRRPDVTAPHNGAPGLVAGPTFGPADPVSPMDLTGLPFTFDVPSGWSCMPSTKMRGDFLAAWTCYDANAANGAGGLVAVQTCPSPCGASDQANLRGLLPVDAGDWRAVDPATMYAEEAGTLTDGADKGAQVNRVAMTYVFAANAGGPLDSVAFAQFTGPPNSKPNMQKVINDVRVHAGG